MAAALGLAFAIPVPAAAQQDDPAEARETTLLIRNFNASMGLNEPDNYGSDAAYAYKNKVWDLALSWSRRACDGNAAEGCDILGRLLAEGRAGTPDPRGAETAHRKAADLYASRCRTGATMIGEICAEAGDFMRGFAVAPVRNEGVARTYYSRARDDYVRRCNDGAYECLMAGLLTNGTYTGRPDPAAAVRLWRRGCDADRSDSNSSCNRLVETLAEGPEGVRDPVEARRRILENQCSLAAPERRETRSGDRLYCAIVAEFLLDGVGGPADPKRGEQLLRFSCVRGQESACKSLDDRGFDRDDLKSAWAMFDLGYLDSAQDLFETRCTANVGVACNEAGRLIGRSQAADSQAKARQLYARACTLGSGAGCYNSGDALRRLGGPVNVAAARTALNRGCTLNDAAACRLVGFMTSNGEGGPADWTEANRLYEIACAGKDAAACLNLGNNLVNGRGLAADPARARVLHQQACDLGNMAGCVNSGFAWGTGRGGPRDDARARALYARACERNDGQGCNNLAFYLREARGGSADHRQSRELYEKGCDLRNADACIGYSDSLLSSLGGPTDRTKAVTARRYACLALNKAEACDWLSDGGHSDPVEEGTILANVGKVDQALPLLRGACDAGKAKGCLGVASFTPRGDAATEARRTADLRKACALGEQSACGLVE